MAGRRRDHNFFVWSNWKDALTANTSQDAGPEHRAGAGDGTGLDLGKTKALVYSALTELMIDGLLRPGEEVKKSGFIPQSDVGFGRDERGRAKSATVMITPIKQRGGHAEDIQKKNGRYQGGSRRHAEDSGAARHTLPRSALRRGGGGDDSGDSLPRREDQGFKQDSEEATREHHYPKTVP